MKIKYIKLQRPGRLKHILMWTAIAFVLFFTCLQLSFTFYFNARLVNDLEKEFLVQTKGAYEMKITEIRTNVFIQSVFVKGFSVNPVKGLHPENSKYHLSSAEINLVNFDLPAFLFKNDFKFAALELVSPKVVFYRNKIDKTEDTANVGEVPFSIYLLLKPHLHSLSVQSINVSDAELKIYEDDRDSLLLLNSSENKLYISNLRISKESHEQGRLFLADKNELTIRNFFFKTPDKLYSISVAKVYASYSDSFVSMDSLQLTPNYSKMEFSQKAAEQTNRIRIAVANLAFRRIDVKLLFEKNWFRAGRLEINKLDLEAYKDKNYERKQHLPEPLQTMIRRIPIFLKIDSVFIKSSYCVYEELPKAAAKTGHISFTHMDAVITGFTNRPHSDMDSEVLSVKIKCKLMDKGKLELNYRFPFNNEGMAFDCFGNLIEMPMAELNGIIQTHFHATVSKGMIDKMDFTFHAGDMSSEGSMKFAYHDLKFLVYQDRGMIRNGASHLYSFITNNLFVKEQNPTGKEPTRVTRIHTLRNRERFIFNYTLKSLLSGIKPAIGLPDLPKKMINKLRG